MKINPKTAFFMFILLNSKVFVAEYVLNGLNSITWCRHVDLLNYGIINFVLENQGTKIIVTQMLTNIFIFHRKTL